MAALNPNLNIVDWSGANIAKADILSQTWGSKVLFIQGINPNTGGTNYQVWIPGGFSSLPSLETGKKYVFFISDALGANVPGANEATAAPLTWHLEITPISESTSIVSGGSSNIIIEQVFSNGSRVDVTYSVTEYDSWGAIDSWGAGWALAKDVTFDTPGALTTSYTENGVTRTAYLGLTVLAPIGTNNPPTTVGGTTQSINLTAGYQTHDIDLAQHFSDTDTLTYNIQSNSNSFDVMASIFNTTFLRLQEVMEGNEGTANIVVRATDTANQWIEKTFAVTIQPTGQTGINDLTYNGEPLAWNGETLTYTV